GVASYTKTRNTTSATPSVDFAKDAVALFQTGSVFLAGKVTNNVGLFTQVTYDNYANQNPDTLAWSGHSHADNIDVRYADRFIDGTKDLIVGASLNNNPSVADVWNTAPAWLQYVPTRFGFTGPSTVPMISQLGQQVAGLSAYTFWNQTLYAELSAYQVAKGAFSLLKQGNDIGNRLKGTNPYLRVALSHDWGAHNAMIGIFGMNADVYPDPSNPSGPSTRYRDRGIDAQYQYLLDPHTVTAQLSYIRENIGGGDITGITANTSNTLNQLRMKGSYIYRAKYGGSLSYFRTTGSSDPTLYPGLQDDGTGTGAMIPIPINGSAANNPETRGWIPELFWTPVQYVRIGLQYFKFDRFNGQTTNYDGAGRSAHDNNTLFLYVWGAY
ncbi:MAG: cytochrome C, partial [bacterium]